MIKNYEKNFGKLKSATENNMGNNDGKLYGK